MSRLFRRRLVSSRRTSPRIGQLHFRQLRAEPLEDRRLLAITVDTLVDEADGSIIDGDVSLRDAIALAPSGETIDFAAELHGGTIELTLGELLIDKTLTIDGPGAELLTIDASGNDPTPDVTNGDGSRVFNINDGDVATNSNVVISGLTVTGGDMGGARGIVVARFWWARTLASTAPQSPAIRAESP